MTKLEHKLFMTGSQLCLVLAVAALKLVWLYTIHAL